MSRTRSTTRRTAAALTAVGAVAVAGAALAGVPWDVETERPAVVATGTGPLPTPPSEDPAGSCHVSYEEQPGAVLEAPLAFAGTVSRIDGGGWLQTHRVTFTVDEWFGGGSGEEMELAFVAPVEAEDGPSYTVGTQLLVAGAPAGEATGLDEPVAWRCGFTRYYDVPTAALWRSLRGS